MTPSVRTAFVLLLFWSSPVLGQRIEVRGRGDADTDAFLRSFVTAGSYTLIARDTTIARGDTVRGNALVLRGRLRLDGVITGDLVIVDGSVFLRPSARVLGDVRNIAGGYYPSEQAGVGGVVESEPNAPYMVQLRDDGSLVILGTSRPSLIVRPGIFGFAAPTYDRVDGLVLSYSTGVLLPRLGRLEPMLLGRVDYRSQRGAFTGGLQLELPRGRTELVLGAERTTVTNERWIRGDLDNSVSFLVAAKDYRDYWEADRVWAELSRVFGPEHRTTTPFLRAQVEEARTLLAATPWTAFGTPREDNLAVDDGRTSSVIAGLRTQWTLPRHVVRLQGSVEAALPVLDADHEFNAWLVDLDWAMAGLADHTLRIQTRFQGPLPGTDSLPRQRWSFVGGSGTLYTFDVAEFRGDRVAFVETLYSIPIAQLRAPLIGPPDLDLLHMAGMAWTAGQRRSFEQNVGLRLRFSVVNIRVVTNPEALVDDVEVSVGVNLPRRRYPWQRERDFPL